MSYEAIHLRIKLAITLIERQIAENEKEFQAALMAGQYDKLTSLQGIGDGLRRAKLILQKEL